MKAPEAIKKMTKNQVTMIWFICEGMVSGLRRFCVSLAITEIKEIHWLMELKRDYDFYSNIEDAKSDCASLNNEKYGVDEAYVSIGIQ